MSILSGCHRIYIPRRWHYSVVLSQSAGGPIIEGRPETFFVYQDHHLSKTFGEAGVDIQQINNVGALVSVVLVESPVSGGPVTTFTVLVPSVGVTEDSPQSFRTKSVTTVQAATLVARQVFPALQTYKVEHLGKETAANVMVRGLNSIQEVCHQPGSCQRGNQANRYSGTYNAAALPRIKTRICARPAPSAIRIPISGVRCMTE